MSRRCYGTISRRLSVVTFILIILHLSNSFKWLINLLILDERRRMPKVWISQNRILPISSYEAATLIVTQSLPALSHGSIRPLKIIMGYISYEPDIILGIYFYIGYSLLLSNRPPDLVVLDYIVYNIKRKFSSSSDIPSSSSVSSSSRHFSLNPRS